jgi:pyruvate ferredoxin oxidoreductase gamma subunit
MTMFQVRFHGRGGQGVVTAAELLADAAFREGRHAQAFPSFGSERMGAPVMSFCRIDDKPIRTREPVTEPDALIIQDPTLLHQADLFAGLGPQGYLLVNSAHGFGELGLEEFVTGFRRDRLLVVPASSLALAHLGRPLPGAALLGGFAALTASLTICPRSPSSQPSSQPRGEGTLVPTRATEVSSTRHGQRRRTLVPAANDSHPYGRRDQRVMLWQSFAVCGLVRGKTRRLR